MCIIFSLEHMFATPEFPEPDVDSYIWCTECDRLEFHGCETHSTLFGDNKMFNLQVGKSAVARNAGQGIFNRGKEVIPEGTLLVQYTICILFYLKKIPSKLFTS